MSRALEKLRRNDPQQTSVDIILNDENDAAIAQALEQNQYVSRVWLHLGRRNTNSDHLCRQLATRANLEFFGLSGYYSQRYPAERILPILQAINQNSAARVFEFSRLLMGAEDLCFFLDSIVHVTDLTLRNFGLTGGEQDARDVAAALQRNTSIETLKLLSVGDSLMDTVLEGLVSNTCLRHLVIQHSSLSEAMRNALRVLLESSTGLIQHLELIGMQFWGQSLSVFAQGLIKSSTVTEITLNSCGFLEEGSIQALNEILEQKQNLCSLAIKRCTFHSRSQQFLQVPFQQFLQVLFSALRRPDSSLRHLQFRVAGIGDSFPNQSFGSLCEAVAESKLVSFLIGEVDNLSRSQTLADSLPSMKIREIVIHFGLLGPNEMDRMQQTLRQAFKDNYSLQSVKDQYGDDPFDSTDEDETLKFYLERNIRLAQWVENPATVPKHLWKEATTLATKAGPTVLFQLLRKIGPEVLPVRGRKRKYNG